MRNPPLSNLNPGSTDRVKGVEDAVNISAEGKEAFKHAAAVEKQKANKMKTMNATSTKRRVAAIVCSNTACRNSLKTICNKHYFCNFVLL